MSTAISSKTGTIVTALAVFGLAAAAGLAYWGYQNFDEFNSDYYKRGYQAETSVQSTIETPVAGEILP
jgi:uncharacterized membrane protein YebE (DUF533 family)